MRPTPHVCIISCCHGPRDARAVHKLAASLRDGGLRVTWVGPRWSTEFGESGIEVLLFESWRARFGRPVHWWRAYRAAHTVHDVDVYLALGPDSAVISWLLAQRGGGRLIFDLHEVYHRDMLKTWIPLALVPIVGGLLRHLIGWIIARSDLLTVSSERVLAPYARNCRQVRVLRNCALSWDRQPVARTRPPECLTVVHGKAALGGSIERRGTSTLLEALAIVKSRGAKVRAIIFDNFDEAAGASQRREIFLREVAVRGLETCIDLHASVPIAQMPSILAQADVGLIAYDREFGINSLPGRLFEYMESGIAVIVPNYAPDICEIVDRERCGLAADCEDPRSIADSLYWLTENRGEMMAMGRRGRAGFEARYRWEDEVRPLVEWIHVHAGLANSAAGAGAKSAP